MDLLVLFINKYILRHILSARRWNYLLNKLGYRISFAYTYILYSKGIAINSILPGGVVGGDIFKSISLISYLKGVNIEQENSRYELF